MAGYNDPPKSTTSNIPIGSVIVPGNATPQALKGGNSYTDAQSNVIAPVAISPEDGAKATYALSVLGVTPVATPTDWITLNFASKVIRIVSVYLSGIATTAGSITFALILRTAANTGGTSVATDAFTRYDSSDGVPTAVQARYTANPASLGAGTNIVTGHLGLPLAGVIQPGLLFTFGNRPGKAVVLRATTQFFCINLNGSTLPAGTALDATIEYTEE